jgi:hypothetical protein
MNIKMILMLLVLVFEAAVLFYYFKWSLLKSVGMSVLINVCSSIAVAVVQYFVSLKLPPHVWHIFMVEQHYFRLMLPLMMVAFCTTVLTEYFLCSMFLQDISRKTVWMVVIGMNVFTIVVLSGSIMIRNRPVIAPGFSLVENAGWLETTGETLYYIDWQSRNIISWKIGTEKGTVLAEAPPIAGYRVSDAHLPVITRTPTNTVSVSGKKMAMPRTFTAVVESCRSTAVSPDSQRVAVHSGSSIDIFTVSGREVVNSIPVTDSHDDIFVCWHTNNLDIVYGSSSGIFSIAWNSTNSVPVPASAGDALASTIFDKEIYSQATNTFTHVDTAITVYMHEGIRIRSPAGDLLFSIDCKATPVLYSGTGFIDDGQTFLFQLFSYSREVMAINLETLQVGHVAEGIYASIDSPPYLVPPAPVQP